PSPLTPALPPLLSLLSSPRPPRALHSFPTRRSSDLSVKLPCRLCCVAAQGQSSVQCGLKRALIGHPLAGNIISCTMIDTRTNKRQPNGNIDPFFQAQIFDRDKPLIVILSDNNIKLAAPSAHENGIARPRTTDVDTFCLGLGNGWANDF